MNGRKVVLFLLRVGLFGIFGMVLSSAADLHYDQWQFYVMFGFAILFWTLGYVEGITNDE